MKTEPLRLLVVEDDHIDQRALQRTIEREKLPYHCVMVTSAQAAREALLTHKFDLVLADYRLDDGTGLEVIEAVEDIPVIFVTGLGSEELAVRAMKAGAYDYLTKDTEHQYLKLLPVVVENTLKRHTAEAEAHEMALERVRREMLERFILDASHDLRTPLSVLNTSMYLQDKFADRLITLLMEKPDHIEELRETALKIKDRGKQMRENRDQLERIINDMIEMVRIDSLTELEKSPVDLNYFVQEIGEAYASYAQSSGYHFVFDLKPEALIIQINQQEFGIVLRKLLDNAFDFTPPGGQITVRTNGSEDEVWVSVRDSGIGIPQEEIPNIFQRFYRVNKARTMSVTDSGTGLGLSIVRRLVDLHGARINVESQPGYGSTFTIHLMRHHASSFAYLT